MVVLYERKRKAAKQKEKTEPPQINRNLNQQTQQTNNGENERKSKKREYNCENRNMKLSFANYSEIIQLTPPKNNDFNRQKKNLI